MKLRGTELTYEDLVDMLKIGIDIADDVVANWSEGDLAGAVNALEEWADNAKRQLP